MCRNTILYVISKRCQKQCVMLNSSMNHANLEKNNKLCVCRRVREEKAEEKKRRKRERVCVYCAYMAVFMRVLAHVCACACGDQRATLGVVLSTVYFSWDRVSRSLSGLELSYELGLLVLGICVSAFPTLGLQKYTTMPDLSYFTGLCGSNSSSHTWKVSTLPTEKSLSPSNQLLKHLSNIVVTC